jgi:2'-5' RNA ligase
MRIFLAIEFSDDIKKYLYNIQEIVKKNSISGKFTDKDNFHLTLRFIGETTEAQLNNLKKAIDNVVLNQEKFELNLSRLGEFPRGRKRIIWLGIEANQMMDRLYLKLENELEKQGYEKEGRDFVPHITMGREVVIAEEFKELERKVKTTDEIVSVGKVSIMESTRIDGKLTYVPIYVREFSLSSKS